MHLLRKVWHIGVRLRGWYTQNHQAGSAIALSYGLFDWTRLEATIILGSVFAFFFLGECARRYSPQLNDLMLWFWGEEYLWLYCCKQDFFHTWTKVNQILVDQSQTTKQSGLAGSTSFKPFVWFTSDRPFYEETWSTFQLGHVLFLDGHGICCCILCTAYCHHSSSLSVGGRPSSFLIWNFIQGNENNPTRKGMSWSTFGIKVDLFIVKETSICANLNIFISI